MQDVEVFKARVKEAIKIAKENGYTQARIGEEADVSPQAVGQWPRTGKVSTANLAVLARLSGKPLDWFYETQHHPTYVDHVADRRRDNLLTLLSERFEGKQAALANAVEREPSYISRCVNGGTHRKRIGEDFARHIEQALELEIGWMDKEPDVKGEDAGHRVEFAARLKQALSFAGIEEWGSGGRLAKMTNVTPKAASKWMNGETRPGHEKLVLIAAQLGVRAEWLEYGVGPMSEAAGSADPRASYGSTTTAPPQHELVMHATEIVEEEGPLRPDEVELPCFHEVEFAAGTGQSQVIENHGHSMRFSLPRLARAGVQPHNAACATASGTSMEPTIADGSPIGIDKGARHVVDGKIYALDHGGLLRVKRLYRLPLGRVRLVSDNAEEYPEEICSLMGEDAPRIIGRVFWWEVFD